MRRLKNIIRAAIFFGCMIFSLTSVHPNDQVIYMRDGKVITGEIVSQTAYKMIVKLPDGSTKEISKQDIKRVAFKEAKTPEPKDKTPVGPPTPTPEEIAKQQEEDSKKQAVLDEKAEKRKKQIEEAKRNRLDIFLGTGSGTVNFQGANFYDNVIAVGSSLGQDSGKFEYPIEPKPKSGKANSFEVRYSWNRYVGEVGASSLTSTATQNIIGLDGSSSGTFPKFIHGNYDVSMKHVYGNFSYSVYPHPKYDIRPVIGYHQFWTKTENSNSIAIGTGAPPSFTEQYFGPDPTSVAEGLKGFSYGVQYDIKFEKFEIRTGLHILQMKGYGTYDRQLNAYAPASAQSQSESIDVYNKWVAKGAIIDLKFLYSWKYGVSFWTGLNSMSWTYTMSETALSVGNESSGVDPQSYVLGKLLFESLVGPGSLKETKATTIQIGATYSYDFNK
ncbi:LA_0442/LA_0875 N-terminal domain-containing protein [Leptospira sp. SA-E8]|uniref:LA_0442/LA_0875 N-terminal domain-containing protein n=1 Tax=Leptospira sp. SA-E8 TaxID=3422259 RepID=UPI003EB95DB6